MSSLSSKKRTKASRQVVKSNLFIRFLEETSACKNHFEFVWPLLSILKYMSNNESIFNPIYALSCPQKIDYASSQGHVPILFDVYY